MYTTVVYIFSIEEGEDRSDNFPRYSCSNKKKIIFHVLARDLGFERARVAIRKHARAISRLPLLPELAIERLII